MKGFLVILLLPAIFFGMPGEKESKLDIFALPAPATDTSAIDRRIMMEEKTEGSPFSITPHRPMFFMPVVYSSNPNSPVYRRFISDADLTTIEAQFQISFKMPLWPRIFGYNMSLYIGYTQLSLWQVYNDEFSSPFRETNYEPELFFRAGMNEEILGTRLRFLTLSFDHQSNGRNAPVSRSWNRLITGVVMEKGSFYWNLRVWIPLPDKSNPDIYEYMGNGDLMVVFVPHRVSKHTVSIYFRPNMRSPSRAAFQTEWSFPLHVNKLRAYIQFFTGYGQSLIDYNHKQTRIGAGVMMTNWL